MPVMDGIEATQAIITYLREKLPEGTQIPTDIVGVTTQLKDDVREKCLNAGMKHVHVKPVTTLFVHKAMWRHCFRISEDEYQLKYEDDFVKPYENNN